PAGSQRELRGDVPHQRASAPDGSSHRSALRPCRLRAIPRRDDFARSSMISAVNVRQPLTIDDLATLVSLEDIALSPDGRRVAAVLETVDEVANEVRRRIVLIDVDRP